MYAGLNGDGDLVYAQNYRKADGTPIYCPHCGQNLVWKRNRKGRAFFAHTYPCGQDLSQKHLGESVGHQASKLFMWSLCKEMGLLSQMEVPVLGGQFIADLRVNNRLIFEFQYAKIGRKDLLYRQSNYHQAGYQAYWFLSEMVFQDKKLKAWLKRCLAKQGKTYYWLALDLSHRQVKVLTVPGLIFPRDQASYLWEISCRNFISRLKKGKFLADIGKGQPYFLKVKPAGQSIIYQKRFGIRNRALSRLINFLYHLGLNLDDLPAQIFDQAWIGLVTAEPAWLTLAWLYAYYYKIGDYQSALEFFHLLLKKDYLRLEGGGLVIDQDQLIVDYVLAAVDLLKNILS